MKNLLDKYYLEIAVFVCGAVVMMVELVGSRFLAPHFGTSLYVWSSVIGVVMGSLSLGYWLGGRMSVVNPRRGIFSLIIFAAALAVVGLALSKDYILAAGDSLAAVSDVRWGSFFAALTLFSLPNVLLGMVSPYAARLKIDQLQDCGRAVGDLYAISTVGSIIGTFTAGFWLIGMFSADQINIYLAAILAAISLAVDFKKARFLKLSVLAAVVVWGFIFDFMAAKKLPLTFDTSYARYLVKDVILDSRSTLRALITDNLGAQSLMLIYDGKPSDEMIVPYNQYFLMGRHFKPDIRHGLLIGGGAFGFTGGFLNSYPEATLDVVEIDPALTGISQKYFNLKTNSRLTIINEDGRVFLNQNKSKYDCVYMDAFNSMAMPFHLATQEAVQKIYGSLNDGAAVFVNVVSASSGDQGKVLRAIKATYENVFPQVYVFATNKEDKSDELSNYVLVALKSDVAPQWISSDPQFDAYLKTRMDQSIENDMPIMTDDRSLLEKYALEIVK